MQKPIISAANIERVFSNGIVDTYALADISLQITQGEFVAIMGPSGSGKSTLLHQLGLLDIPTKGAITIDGEDVVHLSDNERTRFRLEKLGYVFQAYNILPELTALENVFITSMAQGKERSEYEQEAKEILGEVGLSDRLHHYPSELSGGQQQRVSIARALVNKPKILFADEPTAHLDTKNSEEIITLFRNLNKKIGQTIVMVSHELQEGKQADRIIWVKDGYVDKR